MVREGRTTLARTSGAPVTSAKRERCETPGRWLAYLDLDMKTFIVIASLVAAVALAEAAAPPWVEAQAEAAITAETDGRIVADVDVSGPPLLIPVLVTGTVSSWKMTLREVGGHELPVDVTLAMRDVVLDRGALFTGNVVVEEVASAVAIVTADMSGSIPDALTPFMDRLADLGLAHLLAEVAGRLVRAEGDVLVAGDLSMPLVGGSCQARAERLVVTTTCELQDVPSFMLRAFQPR